MTSYGCWPTFHVSDARGEALTPPGNMVVGALGDEPVAKPASRTKSSEKPERCQFSPKHQMAVFARFRGLPVGGGVDGLSHTLPLPRLAGTFLRLDPFQ